MDDARWHALMANDEMQLTESELSDGWHFCVDWDGLLIGPGMGEMHICTCGRHSDHDLTHMEDGLDV